MGWTTGLASPKLGLVLADLDDSELLSLMIGPAWARRLEAYPLAQLLEADGRELAALGLPSRLRRVLMAGSEVARRHQPVLGASHGVNGPRHALGHLRELRGLDKEVIAVLLLDSRLAPLGVEKVAQGTVAHVGGSAREVFAPAFRVGASALVLAHNHPSGRPDPSPADIDFTRSMVEAGQVLEVSVLDHVIVSRRAYFSFVEAGLM